MVEAIEEVKRMRPASRATMSCTTSLQRWTVERTLRSISRSSLRSSVSRAKSPPAPIPALRTRASTGRAVAWMRS